MDALLGRILPGVYGNLLTLRPLWSVRGKEFWLSLYSGIRITLVTWSLSVRGLRPTLCFHLYLLSQTRECQCEFFQYTFLVFVNFMPIFLYIFYRFHLEKTWKHSYDMSDVAWALWCDIDFFFFFITIVYMWLQTTTVQPCWGWRQTRRCWGSWWRLKSPVCGRPWWIIMSCGPWWCPDGSSVST